MATLAQKIQCERDAREMLKQNGLPDPDRVEYGYTCIRLFFEATKVMLVVEIDEPPEGFEVVGDCLEDLDEDDTDNEPEDCDWDDIEELLKRVDHDPEEVE
jgi:hypothetical protein